MNSGLLTVVGQATIYQCIHNTSAILATNKEYMGKLETTSTIKRMVKALHQSHVLVLSSVATLQRLWHHCYVIANVCTCIQNYQHRISLIEIGKLVSGKFLHILDRLAHTTNVRGIKLGAVCLTKKGKKNKERKE